MNAVIIGCGAVGQQSLDILLDQESHRILGFLDDNSTLWGTTVNGVEVLGGVEMLSQMDTSELGVLIALADYRTKSAIISKLSALNLSWINAIHPTSAVMRSAKVGKGCIFQAGTVLDTMSKTGNHVLVWAGATVGYGCVLENSSVLAAGVHLAGNNVVGRGAFVGVGVSVCPNVRIGAGSVVGAGAAVTQDIPDGVLAVGIPSRVVKTIDADFDWYGRVFAGIRRER